MREIFNSTLKTASVPRTPVIRINYVRVHSDIPEDAYW